MENAQFLKNADVFVTLAHLVPLANKISNLHKLPAKRARNVDYSVIIYAAKST